MRGVPVGGGGTGEGAGGRVLVGGGGEGEGCGGSSAVVELAGDGAGGIEIEIKKNPPTSLTGQYAAHTPGGPGFDSQAPQYFFMHFKCCFYIYLCLNMFKLV